MGRHGSHMAGVMNLALNQPEEFEMKIADATEEMMLGRWVRSPSKYDNWEAYMDWFGMSAQEIRDETVEPQIHVIKAFSKESITILHILPERDGLQVEYTVPIDGKQYQIPPIMVKNARSSWKGNQTWAHEWTERGLRTLQVLDFPKGKFYLRYWRNLLNEDEIQISVELSDYETDTVQIATNRYFRRIPYIKTWKAATAQFFSGKDVASNIALCSGYIQKAAAEGAKLIVLPENSNRERDYFENGRPSKCLCWESSETIQGPFVSAMQEAAKPNSIWVAVGVDLRGEEEGCVYIAQMLIGPEGFLHGIHKKHVLWDYEYTLFEPGSVPYRVYDTELGRLGLLVCADGIVPEAARVMGCMGAQGLLNSLNSRGPDELRMHIPCRAQENGCWHISSNTVGNTNTTGPLWPWTGGSQVVAPDGTRVVEASETEEGMVTAQIELDHVWTEFTDSSSGNTVSRNFLGIDPIKSRRPRLYQMMVDPLDEVPAATMYGPAPDEMNDSFKLALMQVSYTHTKQCTLWCALKQIAYAKKKGAPFGLMPALFCFAPGEVATDRAAAAAYSAEVLAELCAASKEHGVWVALSLVEQDGDKFYHTAC